MFQLPILAQVDQKIKYIAFIVINGLIVVMSLVTFGLTSVYNDCDNLDYVKIYLTALCESVNQPSVGYLAMCGIFTFIYSAFSLFVFFDDRFLIGKKNITLRILVLGSIFIFAYNFALATASSLGAITWKKSVQRALNTNGSVFIGAPKILIDFLTAFAILQFLINLPCIIITYFYWNQSLHIKANDQTKVANQITVTNETKSQLQLVNTITNTKQ